MANKVTGNTDASGALTTIPKAVKSVLVIGKVKGEATNKTIKEKEIFAITGTADATAVFGSESITQKIVRTLIAGGCDNIRGIVVPATGETALADALEVTMSDNTIRCIVADNNDTATVSAVKDHLVVAESNDKFRYACFAPSAENTASQTKLTAYAKTIDCDRIFIPGATLLQSDAEADPQVIAAGLAAAIMTETYDPALPLNGVTLKGFNGMQRTMLESEMNALANAGVTPIYMEGSTPAIFRLVTSKIDDKVWQEGTTRFIADYVLESNETLLRANYKRTKNVTRILNSIRDDIKINMEKMAGLEIIENWDEATLTVSKDPQDLYGALVDYEFDVVTPLYTITIRQHMKL